jgi:lipid II:glycine glycyltransferase (peptidoglycan interpeptide bridge formation enzyme)
LESVFQNFNHAKRKNIKKAEKFLEVRYDLPAKKFYENHKMTLEKQNSKISYSFEHFNRIYSSAYAHNAGRTIYAVDSEDNIHAGLFVIWDKNSAYDLISTIDPTFRNSGGASLLIREIIKFISTKTDKFDFEGSMIESVEKSFRQFGAKQKPYFDITKIDSKILKTVL